jgi:hypothetical protein
MVLFVWSRHVLPTLAGRQNPHDMFGVSLCRVHHDQQHSLGAAAFGRKYRIDLWALTAEFARRSPDWEMRASLKLIHG